MKLYSKYLAFGFAILFAFAVNTFAQSSPAQPDETATAPTTGTISGQVLSESGKPVANATIYLRGSRPLFQPRITATDSGGNFQVANLDPLLYGITATSPSYVTPPPEPDSPPTYYRIGDKVTLNLVKGGVITGSVLSPLGEPVVQVLVRAVMVRDANGQRPRYLAYQAQKTTDDRGIYRLYGLIPGTYVVFAGGRAGFAGSGYDTDSPTYAPSSTRDTAADIVVRAGEEVIADIRYRGDPGRTLSGSVVGLSEQDTRQTNVTLVQIANDAPMTAAYSFQPPGSKGFSFYGVADGDYDLMAQTTYGPGEVNVSEPRRVTVKGADVTGIELLVRPLASISGQLILESSTAVECKNKRRPLLTETLVSARRVEKDRAKDQPQTMGFMYAQGSPEKGGEFSLRNLSAGQYNMDTRYYAKYWYLRSVTREGPVVPAATTRTTPARRQTDVARTGLALKTGDRVSGITVTLSEGAASLRGTVKTAEGQSIPPNLYVHLLPAEKESTDDLLRYFADDVKADGTFALNNVAPGRYTILTRVAAAGEPPLTTKVRASEENELRNRLKLAAGSGAAIELKPCQNVIDHQLSFPPVIVK